MAWCCLKDFLRQHQTPSKVVITVVLCVLMLANSNLAYANDAPSSWAEEYVNTAITTNLVPQNLRNNYTQAITRSEFCALGVHLYELVMGEITGRKTFLDTTDVNVAKMAYLGVVTGVGNYLFDPNAPLTREQAATLLFRLIEVIVGDWFAPTQITSFYDMGSISSWAEDAIQMVVGANIMSGIEDNLFAPQPPFTREQSIVTIIRVHELVTRDESALSGNVVLDLPILSQPLSFDIGYVTIVSHGITHQPYEHVSHMAMFLGGGLMSGTGASLSLSEVAATLSEIVYSDDFKIVIEGDYASEPRFSLYDSNFNLIYSSKYSFVSIEGTGLYILAVDVTWSNINNLPELMESTSIRYLFKIRVE